MDKNAILEAARNNGDRGNEYERHESKKSLAISLLATVILGLFLFLYDCFVNGIYNLSLIILGATMLGVDHLYEGIAIRRGKYIFIGITLLIFASIFFMLWVVL